ncbi:MAG: nicotinamide riboside transporter PnuC [Hyphomonadaceae bacterium]
MTDPLELAATVLTLVSVILSVKRSLWQFPFGIAGTTLGFFVFWGAGLYSSAVLQPFFVAVLVYGWGYWLRGEDSRRPRIKSTKLWIVSGACVGALALAAAAALALETYSDANMALGDASILALSVVAQILLSRKQIENWHVWILINAISIYVYASQALWLYTALYVFFFFNAFWGWWEWRREMRSYQSAT